MNRRKFASLSLGLVTTAAFTAVAGPAHAKEKVIKIRASAFEYNPPEITLKKGEPVVLELTSADLFHGFNCTERQSFEPVSAALALERSLEFLRRTIG